MFDLSVLNECLNLNKCLTNDLNANVVQFEIEFQNVVKFVTFLNGLIFWHLWNTRKSINQLCLIRKIDVVLIFPWKFFWAKQKHNIHRINPQKTTAANFLTSHHDDDSYKAERRGRYSNNKLSHSIIYYFVTFLDPTPMNDTFSSPPFSWMFTFRSRECATSWQPKYITHFKRPKIELELKQISMIWK